MASRMLINATQEEEIRVALVNGSRLENLDLEIQGKEQQKANIYKAKITRIEPSLEAVFVDYGGERHGFLPFREISRTYLKNTGNPEVDDKTSLRSKLSEGQEIIIQIEKESRGNKGAALTTYVSLAGCYLVLMPNNPKAGGISRRIDGDERTEVREVLNQLNIPADMGVIVRTAGMGRNIKDLQWDLDVLVQQWHSIEKAAIDRPSPFLIYQESSLVVRAIRDHLRPDITEILVDSAKVFEDAAMHIRMMRPDFISKLKLYNDSIPLFSRFQIESQIEMAFQRSINLPSGGSVVIDHTEALISIDINSAKATRGGDIEETAYHTNLEAAEEIARQLRLRDIGGLIVIDFIDMSVLKNQRAVEQKLKEALEMDRARVQVGRISRFGLLEMSRQRLRPALAAARDVSCPRCSGQGTIRSVEVLALNMIRLIEEEAIKDSTSQVLLEVPVEVATYLINEKRQAIIDIERKHHIRIILVPSTHLFTPSYSLKRVRKDETPELNDDTASYTLSTKPEQPKSQYANKAVPVNKNNIPAVSNFNPSMAPQRTGIIRRFISSILGSEDTSQISDAANEGEARTPTTTNTRYTQRPPQNNRNRNQRGRNNRNNDRRPNKVDSHQTPAPNLNIATAAPVTVEASTSAPAINKPEDGSTPEQRANQPRKRTGQRRHQYRNKNRQNKPTEGQDGASHDAASTSSPATANTSTEKVPSSTE